MKKIVDDARLIYKCCYLYYVDGMGQREICDAVGISRDCFPPVACREGNRCCENRTGKSG
ncbi:MAG: hypothetical protein ACLRL6_08915 [Clostridium sp.]